MALLNPLRKHTQQQVKRVTAQAHQHYLDRQKLQSCPSHHVAFASRQPTASTHAVASTATVASTAGVASSAVKASTATVATTTTVTLVPVSHAAPSLTQPHLSSGQDHSTAACPQNGSNMVTDSSATNHAAVDHYVTNSATNSIAVAHSVTNSATNHAAVDHCVTNSAINTTTAKHHAASMAAGVREFRECFLKKDTSSHAHCVTAGKRETKARAQARTHDAQHSSRGSAYMAQVSKKVEGSTLPHCSYRAASVHHAGLSTLPTCLPSYGTSSFSPRMEPNVALSVMPGTEPSVMLGMEPSTAPSMMSGLMPGMEPGTAPSMMSGLMPGLEPGVVPTIMQRGGQDGLEQDAGAGMALSTGSEPATPQDSQDKASALQTTQVNPAALQQIVAAAGATGATGATIPAVAAITANLASVLAGATGATALATGMGTESSVSTPTIATVATIPSGAAVTAAPRSGSAETGHTVTADSTASAATPAGVATSGATPAGAAPAFATPAGAVPALATPALAASAGAASAETASEDTVTMLLQVAVPSVSRAYHIPTTVVLQQLGHRSYGYTLKDIDSLQAIRSFNLRYFRQKKLQELKETFTRLLQPLFAGSGAEFKPRTVYVLTLDRLAQAMSITGGFCVMEQSAFYEHYRAQTLYPGVLYGRSYWELLYPQPQDLQQLYSALELSDSTIMTYFISKLAPSLPPELWQATASTYMLSPRLAAHALNTLSQATGTTSGFATGSTVGSNASSTAGSAFLTKSTENSQRHNKEMSSTTRQLPTTKTIATANCPPLAQVVSPTAAPSSAHTTLSSAGLVKVYPRTPNRNCAKQIPQGDSPELVSPASAAAPKINLGNILERQLSLVKHSKPQQLNSLSQIFNQQALILAAQDDEGSSQPQPQPQLSPKATLRGATTSITLSQPLSLELLSRSTKRSFKWQDRTPAISKAKTAGLAKPPTTGLTKLPTASLTKTLSTDLTKAQQAASSTMSSSGLAKRASAIQAVLPTSMSLIKAKATQESPDSDSAAACLSSHFKLSLAALLNSTSRTSPSKLAPDGSQPAKESSKPATGGSKPTKGTTKGVTTGGTTGAPQTSKTANSITPPRNRATAR